MNAAIPSESRPASEHGPAFRILASWNSRQLAAQVIHALGCTHCSRYLQICSRLEGAPVGLQRSRAAATSCRWVLEEVVRRFREFYQRLRDASEDDLGEGYEVWEELLPVVSTFEAVVSGHRHVLKWIRDNAPDLGNVIVRAALLVESDVLLVLDARMCLAARKSLVRLYESVNTLQALDRRADPQRVSFSAETKDVMESRIRGWVEQSRRSPGRGDSVDRALRAVHMAFCNGIRREFEADVVRELARRVCFNTRCPLGERPSHTWACSACLLARYCSRECQRADWPAHRVLCRTEQAPPTPEGFLPLCEMRGPGPVALGA